MENGNIQVHAIFKQINQVCVLMVTTQQTVDHFTEQPFKQHCSGV